MDSSDFFRAMNGVAPLDREKSKGRDIRPVAPPPTPPSRTDEEATALAALHDLVEGRVEFTLEYSDEYVQGFVTDLDPKIYRQLRAGQYSARSPSRPPRVQHRAGHADVVAVRPRALPGREALSARHPGRGANSPGGVAVLKEELKAWLTRDPLKRVVLAFATALPRHGGAGALYVLLRKFKKSKGKVRFERDWPEFG
jgi:DNA-nicking Smr family endonuclease